MGIYGPNGHFRFRTSVMHQLAKIYRYRGEGTGGAWGAIALTIFLEIGAISALSTLNIFRSEEGAAQKKNH